MTVKDKFDKLLNHLGLSHRSISLELGYSDSYMNKIITGRSSPTLDLYQKLLEKYPELSRNWLFFDEGEMLIETAAPKATPSYSQEKQAEANVFFLEARAAAGGPALIQSQQALDALPKGYLPMLSGKEKHLCIEVTGNSMEPTLLNHDTLICRQLQKGKNLQNGQVYVVVTNDGAVAKRIVLTAAQKNTLILTSDNAMYPSYELPLDEVIQIWQPVYRMTQVLTNEMATLSGAVFRLEKEMSQLKSALQALSNQ